MERTDYLIIGAGISGLLCATELQAGGFTVTVLDKGRGCGGRMATRRMSGARIDHGAQFFTVRDVRFQSYVDTWLNAGVIREWFRHLPEDSNPAGYPRYCGIKGMTDVPKYLAQSLSTFQGEQVVELVKDLNYWTARTQNGGQYSGRHLIVTTPLPQAISLLETSGINWAGDASKDLKAIHYEKGLATLAILEGPSGIKAPGGIKIDDEAISWIGDNLQKGISKDVFALTIHSTEMFAEAYWDRSDSERGALILDAAKPYLSSEVVEFACHRWAFTTPINPWHEPSFHNFDIQLSLAGDAFGGPRVEGAALSGLAAASEIMASA